MKIVKKMINEVFFNITDRVTPEMITSLEPDEIFVFGSNEKGIHGGGAAKAAMNFGAEWGNGVGIQGNTYAIPTLTLPGGAKEHMLPVAKIAGYVNDFLHFAAKHPDYKFYVTPIGCGIAGFTPEQMAPLFKKAVDMKNVYLPKDFLKVLGVTPMSLGGLRDKISGAISRVLKESPDYCLSNFYTNKDAVPFFTHRDTGEIFVGTRGTAHIQMAKELMLNGRIPKIDITTAMPEDYTIPSETGRWWMKDNIISFWRTPDYYTIREILDALNKAGYEIDRKRLIVNPWDIFEKENIEVPYNWFKNGVFKSIRNTMVNCRHNINEDYFEIETTNAGTKIGTWDGDIMSRYEWMLSKNKVVAESKRK